MITIIIIIIGAKLGFSFVKPEYSDTMLPIILLTFLPDICSGFWIRGIIKYVITMEKHLDIKTVLSFNQKIFFIHFLKILTACINLRPNRYHWLHAHFFNTFNHRF